MRITESRQHDILLVISSILFILFASGLLVQTELTVNTTIIPSA